VKSKASRSNPKEYIKTIML
jgi:hypothetical protein